jgi:hypothetical protein
VLLAAEAQAAASEAAAALKSLPEKAYLDRLHTFEAAQFGALASGWEDFQRMLAAAPFGIEKLPAALAERYRGKSGRYALFVSPAVNVRLESQAKLFINQVASVDSEVTGVPILVDEVMVLLRRGFKQATIYSLLVVLLLISLDFRTVRETVLALAPLGVSLALTMGLMRLSGVKFNPANFVSLPVLTGLCMAYGVYLLHRMRQEPEAGPVNAVKTTGKSILLSCLTSLVGFGALLIAGNRGLSSLGWILVVGLSSSLVCCYTLLPALTDLVGHHEAQLRRRLARLKDELLGFRL